MAETRRLNENLASGNEIDNKAKPEVLTRNKLKKLEEKEKTAFQKFLDIIIIFLPLICGGIAILEYVLIPDKSPNKNPERYIYALLFFMGLYTCYGIFAFLNKSRESKFYEKLRYYAPLYSGIFLFLTFYDFMTLKTGILTQPFVPCMNFIINAAIMDYAMLIDCTVNTLILLFLGYFIGVASGLVTGITCGYSKKIRYWVSPIISFLGPIPTVTWIPIMMVIASSLYVGSVFIIALGAWFSVTVAAMTGISNVNRDYFDAAKTLGASKTQLVFKIAIPSAIPSILQGCTQAMSSACVSIMIAEMLGVKSGLGWYMTWQKSWASYDKMFAALFVICIIFILVTKTLNKIKHYLLRWQLGEEK